MKNIKLRIMYLILCSALLLFAPVSYTHLGFRILHRDLPRADPGAAKEGI